MPDDDGQQGATPDPKGATPAGGQGTTAPAAGDPQAQPQGAAEDRAAANAREAMARMAAERDAAREELRKLKEKDLPEAERQARRLAQLEAQLAEERAANRATALRLATTERATRLGYVDPTDAYLLVRDDVEVDDKGQPTNLDKLLGDLAKAKPYLVGKARSNGTADQGSRGGAGSGQPFDMNAAIRAARGQRVVTTTTGD